MKPMLASDWDESKVRFPLIAQPKIDGVRGLNMDGTFTGRSLKQHKNKFTTEFYSKDFLKGFDGEVAAADEHDPALCRKTSSALSTIEGKPFTFWWIFDCVTERTISLPYRDRLGIARDRIQTLRNAGYEEARHLRLIPWEIVTTMDELNELDAFHLSRGFEGTIIRDPAGLHKQGRSTVREGGLLRIKRFVEEEAVVIGIEEGKSNQNEAQVNELGLQFRSTHREGMVPNGMVGNLICRSAKRNNEEFVVGPGRMPHEDRIRYFQNQSELIGKTIKYKHFPKGVKDKQRFPTFQCIRAEEDM